MAAQSASIRKGKFKMKISNLRKKIFSLVLLMMIVAFLDELAFAQTPVSLRGHRLYRRRGLMNGNLVSTLFWNYCEVGDYPDEPSGCWPSAERHYLDDITLIVSVQTQNREGETIYPMETQYREFVDTSPEGIPWGFEPQPFWFNMDEQYNTSPAMSNDPNTWPDYWPDKDLSWNGYWNGYFGKGVLNADLETVFVFDDNPDKEPNTKWNFYCDEQDTTRGGIGLVVKARGFQWSQVLAEDCIFWLYDIKNESTHDYPLSYFAQYIDWGIGGVGGEVQNIGEYDTDLDIAFAYGPPGAVGTPGNWYPIGYAGYAFLESPGISNDLKDNDNDGITDEARESDGPGYYISDYPYGFSDADWNKFVQMYNYPPRAHWSADEDCDWTSYTDVNGNGVWDSDEPLNDDLGKDGIGPYDSQYTSPDEGEGDGFPTDQEPNYNATDPDESDQIGLTGFEIFPTHTYELTNDEENYHVFAKAPLPMDQILQPNNLSMFFSSGAFPLRQGNIERYSMALLFGEDRDDLFKNKKTVQQIYNSDYSFAKPPNKPHLKVYPGDHEVTLVWDDLAEKSYDPFLQEYDFEGYMIYRGTEPDFLESKVITDAYGNATYRKPVAQFDLQDGRKGPHPVAIYGVQFNLGDDTGLKHSYTDTDVRNGQTYYYAVVSYDYGLYNYGTSGVEGIQPSECSCIINTNSLGQVTFLDVNCGIAVPRPASAGYIEPGLEGDVEHVGPGTGSIDIDIVEKYKVPSGLTTYEIAFLEDSKYHTETRPYYQIRNVVADTLVLDSAIVSTYGHESSVIDGFVTTVYNDTDIVFDESNSGFCAGSSDYLLKVRLNPDNEDVAGYRMNLDLPADFLVTFHNDVYKNSLKLWSYYSCPSNVEVYNLTDSIEMDYAIIDNDSSLTYTDGDDIALIVPDESFPLKKYTSWMIRLSPVFEIDTTWIDGVPYADTTWTTLDPPEPGEQLIIKMKKPFRAGDVFRFTIQGADSSDALAKSEMDDICVVPNPYVVTASWEPANTYKYGRGERRLHFFHLPRQCTIRIYNLRGHLIDMIEHNSTADDGMEPWDILSKEGNEISYGIYIYQVDAPGVGTKIGKFALIK